jgi:hypothetical protein
MQAILVIAIISLAGVSGLPSNVDFVQGRGKPLRIRGGGPALVTQEQLFDVTAGLGIVQVESRVPSNF